MDTEAKERLKNTIRAKCAVCQSGRQYTNPLAKCFECKKKFCFDHINGGQLNKKMKSNETIRDVCADCVKKFNYYDI